ncbi:MAG TPA: zinc-binding alcohol dehydrogenase family protein [Tepidisphaeraceae bacterium]|nr:zinc-binding alcohol dehydrogenase family protein [Tepidisphaeraceae bacterium]
MKAWVIEQIGKLDLKLVDVEEPKLGDDQVMIEPAFAALNPADRYLAEGAYPATPPMPHILGRDGVGKVVAVGKNVKDVPIGSMRVILRGETGVSVWGTFAERVAVNADSVAEVPKNWSLEESAGAALVYLTAYQSIKQWEGGRPDLPEHANVLITGASGGVGVASIHLAKAMGHKVFALTRGRSKFDELTKLGADVVIDIEHSDWKKQLRGEKINLAIDNIGGPLFNTIISVMAQYGRISVVGRLAGVVPEFNPATLFFKRIWIGGVFVGDYGRDDAQQALKASVDLLSRINAKPAVDSVFEFDKLPEAFGRLREGPVGKVLVRITVD